MTRVARLGALLACCVWGAIAGWAAALAVADPAAPPGATLLAYGAVALFGAGYLAGSALRGRLPRPLAVRAAAITAVAALAAKALVPALAAWVAFLVAAAVFGVLCGLARTTTSGRRRGSPPRA